MSIPSVGGLCLRHEHRSHSAAIVIRNLARILFIACLFVAAVLGPRQASAGTLGRDKGAQNVQNVPDVTGMRYLLVNDDLVLLQVNMGSNNQMITSLNTFDTENSGFGSQGHLPVSNVNTGGQFNLNGVPSRRPREECMKHTATSSRC
jgi:hypothetical protein